MDTHKDSERNAIRLAHLETEVSSLRGDFAEVKLAMNRVFDRLESLALKGNPSWQAIIAFVFSGISALSIIGGGIGIVVTLFVRSETNALRQEQVVAEKTLEKITIVTERNSEQRVGMEARLQSVERTLNRIESK